jgi:threonine/homoserine/homoserine lactone efflux protein
MGDFLPYLFSGMVFGLSGGMSPGPLQMLIFSQTLLFNVREGMKVAFAPLLTDLPIILISLLILSRLSNYRSILGVISIAGGIYLLFLGFKNLRFKGFVIEDQCCKPQSIRRGVLTNFLNPSPYLFWITVGGPLASKAIRIHIMTVVLFLLGLYGCLIGSKLILAFLVDKSRAILKSRIYIWMIRLLGLILLAIAFLFFSNGFSYLGLMIWNISF